MRHNFVILGHFSLFHSPADPEKQNFEILKKTPGDIIILQMCTINEDHMMYGSCDMMEGDGQNLVILDHFFPF